MYLQIIGFNARVTCIYEEGCDVITGTNRSDPRVCSALKLQKGLEYFLKPVTAFGDLESYHLDIPCLLY